jgi:hypothetical protein
MIVVSAPGTRCPKEGKPREYIDADASQDVPDTTYYRRLVADGSLLMAPSELMAEPARKSRAAAEKRPDE